MKIINNITEMLADDLRHEIAVQSKLSIAAACFSVYAYEELREQLEQVDEFRFIFTSPTFLSEPTPKEKREFYIMIAMTFAADNAAVPFVMGAALVPILLVVGEAKGGTRSGSGKPPGPGGRTPRGRAPRCPHCGSPVTVRGSRWAWGRCGAFGQIPSFESYSGTCWYRLRGTTVRCPRPVPWHNQQPTTVGRSESDFYG